MVITIQREQRPGGNSKYNDFVDYSQNKTEREIDEVTLKTG